MRPEEGSDLKAGAAAPTMNQNKAAFIRFFLGGLSGAFAKTLVAPLDRVKIIFQISRKPFSFAAVAAELRRTVEVDGWRGLFRGNTAQVLRVLPYSGSQLACFDVFSGLILAHRGGGVPGASPAGAGGAAGGAGGGRSAASQLGPLDRMAAGAAAGAVSVVLTYPLDLLRARLAVAQELPGGPKGTVKGLFSTLRTMLERDSFFSLYRGLSPTLLGILPYAGISFAVYEALKQWSRETRGAREPLVVERLLFGGIAGFAGQASAYPLDIVRRRMQTAGFTPYHAHLHPHDTVGGVDAPTTVKQPQGGPAATQKALATVSWGIRKRLLPRDGGAMDVFLRVMETEGVIRGLFKGLTMNIVKGPLAVGVSFCVYDSLKTLAGVDGLGGRGGGE